jgi:hypothetical protein
MKEKNTQVWNNDLNSIKVFNKMSSKILILQTCDDKSKYNQMLDITSEINKKYCDQHGYSYAEFRGIKRGVHPWHATFNRIYLIREIMVNHPKYEWVMYIDADAMVVDFNRTIEDVIADANAQDKVIIIDGYGLEHENIKINAGIFLFNMKHESSMNLIELWRHSCEIMINSDDLERYKEHSIPTTRFLLDDQFALMLIFNMLTMSERFSRVVCRLLGKTLSTFVIQELRPNRGIDRVDVEARIYKLYEKSKNVKIEYGLH